MESLKVTDDQSKAVQKTPNRVSLDDIQAEIEEVEFYSPNLLPTMTVCLIRLKNGYVVIGKSTPADPENFDRELGAKFAREDAIRKIWPLMAFRMRDKMVGHE